ncbi:FRG domain-containing protein [Streptomyces chartreusis]
MDRDESPLTRRFFGEREINDKVGIDSEESLWQWIEADTPTPHPKGFVQPPPDSDRIYYRGQSNADNNLSSNLFRTLTNFKESVTEEDMNNAEQTLIHHMRAEEGLGRRMTDGELLAVLQHWGIPTRLIDVSDLPLEALFFAVDHDLGLDGRLFVIELPARLNGHPDTISLAPPRQRLEWRNCAREEWTGRVAVINPRDLDPRMRAQRGRFLVGGLTASHELRRMRFEHRGLTVNEQRQITNLNIRFPQLSTPGNGWPATAWTVKIDKAWKIGLRKRLEKLSDRISTDTMYPPVNEVRRVARRLVEQEARTVHVPGEL